MVHLHHDVAYPVKEVAVVGDHEQCTSRASEIAFEELDRVDVEVVGRLVHDEELSLAGKHLGEGDALYLSSRQFLHELVRVVEVEVAEELHDPSLIFPYMLLIETFGEFRA